MDLKKIRKKEKKEPQPKVKHLSQKKANRVVFAIVFLLFLAAIVGVIRSNVVAMNFDQLASKVEQINQDNQKTTETKESYDPAALAFYATSFAKEYLNMDGKAEEVKQKERLDRLANYLSFDVALIDEKGNEQLEFSRHFKQATVTRTVEETECLLVYLNVVYEVKSTEETETRTQEMVLPIQAKDQLFAIVSRPYFLTSRLPQGKTDQLEKTKETIELSGNEKEEVETFLKMFFEKYASADKQELMLLMKEAIESPEGLELVAVDTSEVTYFDTQQQDVLGVQVSVTFADSLTNAAYTENFSLWLTRTENSYFVNTLKHYFTEKEGN